MRGFVTRVVPLDIKYQVILALAENKNIENIQDCIKLFEQLEQSNFEREGFYYNFSLLYYQLNDVAKAKTYLEKEFDAYRQEYCMLELLKMRYGTSDFKISQEASFCLSTKSLYPSRL